MKHTEARALIRDGVALGGVWADLGAGTGTFTRVLSELLGPEGVIYAIDRDAHAVRALRQLQGTGAPVHAHEADFRQPLSLPPLDGVLMANALHYARRPAAVLRQIVNHLQPEGRLLLVEYDRERGNRWVPYPVPPERFRTLAAEVGLSAPREIGRRRSTFGRQEMYAALAQQKAAPIRNTNQELDR